MNLSKNLYFEGVLHLKLGQVLAFNSYQLVIQYILDIEKITGGKDAILLHGKGRDVEQLAIIEKLQYIMLKHMTYQY